MYKTFTLEERQEIAQANILAKSYFDQIAHNFKNYSEFVTLLKKNYSKIYDMLPSNLKSKFFDDIMILKSPLKYEDKMQDVCKGIVLTAVKTPDMISAAQLKIGSYPPSCLLSLSPLASNCLSRPTS